MYETDDTKDITPWSSTSPSWTKSLKRFFNIHENWSVEDNVWYEARPIVVIKKCGAYKKIHFFYLKIQLLITN